MSSNVLRGRSGPFGDAARADAGVEAGRHHAPRLYPRAAGGSGRPLLRCWLRRAMRSWPCVAVHTVSGRHCRAGAGPWLSCASRSSHCASALMVSAAVHSLSYGPSVARRGGGASTPPTSAFCGLCRCNCGTRAPGSWARVSRCRVARAWRSSWAARQCFISHSLGRTRRQHEGLCSWCAPWASAERNDSCACSAAGLLRRGHTVKVLLYYGGEPLESATTRDGRDRHRSPQGRPLAQPRVSDTPGAPGSRGAARRGVCPAATVESSGIAVALRRRRLRDCLWGARRGRQIAAA